MVGDNQSVLFSTWTGFTQVSLSDPRDLPFTCKEKLFFQCQAILHNKTSTILQDLRDQEHHLQITLLALQDEITSQQGGAAKKIGKVCRQEKKNGAEFALQKGETNRASYIKFSWICCPDETGLCVPECFEEFHTELNVTNYNEYGVHLDTSKDVIIMKTVSKYSQDVLDIM